jgi:WD40-like Beta Propeller Repeat
VLAVVGGVLLTSIVWSLRQAPAAPRETVARFAIALPDGFRVADDAPALAFAPDSSAVAFVVGREDEPSRLFVRSLADAASRPLAGTEGAEAPFFAPDARSIAYFARGRLWRVPLDGGEPVALAEAPAPAGGTWTTDDAIVFAARWGEGLSSIAAAGGTVRALTRLDSEAREIRHAWPQVDPSTGLLLYASQRDATGEGSRVQARSIATLRTSTLVTHASFPWLLPSGHLLTWRDGRPSAVLFDRRTLIADGQTPLPFSARSTSSGVPQFALSMRGAAVSVPAPPTAVILSWITSDGRSADGPWPHRLAPITLDANGEDLLAVTVEPGDPEYWRINLARGTEVRADARLQMTEGGLSVRTTAGPTTGLDISVVTAGSAMADGVVAQVQTAADEMAPALSPDGSTLAWQSKSGDAWQIALGAVSRLSDPSTTDIVARGTSPRWSRDGTTLWFLQGDALMASAIDRASATSAPARLIARGIARILGTAPDGRVLVVRRAPPSATLDVVLGWAEEVRARLSPSQPLPRSFR